MKYKSDKFIVIAFLFLIFSIFIFYPIKELLIQLNISHVEMDGNWKTHIDSNKGILSGYYNKVESLKNAIDNRTINYFPLYSNLLSSYNKANQTVNKLLYTRYIPSGINGDGEYVIKDTKYNKLYLLSSMTNEALDKKSREYINFYNELSKNVDCNFYVYLPSRYEFQKNLNKDFKYRDMSKYTDKFIDEIPNMTIKELEIDNIEEYHDYFFGTDHHWNMYGAYKGYTEIMKMMNMRRYNEAEIFKVKDITFRGSMANSIKERSLHDEFYDINIKFKEHSILVNDEEIPSKYKPRNSEEINKNKAEFYDYYIGYYYGLYGRVVYDFNQNHRPNLLIISDSYSWAIDHLIASNFNETHVINIMYDEFKDNKFNIKEYVKENQISEVLILQETHTTVLDVYNHKLSERVVW